jgi:uncharacterized membrane protein YphA (DoxX/SURF4 family)
MLVRSRDSSFWHALFGLAFVVTGTDKLFGMGAYSRMFHDLGWSEDQMRLVGLAELAGGTLIAAEATRRIGGALLAGASATVLASELRHRDGKRALSRLGLMVAVVHTAWPSRSAR